MRKSESKKESKCERKRVSVREESECEKESECERKRVVVREREWLKERD